MSITLTELKQAIKESDKETVADILDTYSEDVLQAALDCGVQVEDIKEAYQGEFRSNEAFAQDMAEQLGAIDKNASWPNDCIDWEKAARELMYDYSESNGRYFRNI